MFLPLLQASQVNNGTAMIGMKVDVYTSANWLFTYQISAVHRHVPSDAHALDGPQAAKDPELWLQTGEGPEGTTTVLLVAAALVSATPSSRASAQPAPKPVVCS
jgi:sortase (surface protein transpeptidase)